jgi:hypothetical protein
MDVQREAYDERRMDALVANEQEWRAREVYCQHKGREGHYQGPRGKLRSVFLCQIDDRWANDSDCSRCNHRGEVR